MTPRFVGTTKRLEMMEDDMPIYEFKCLKCEACFELLLMGKNEELETTCPECQSEDFERVLSCTNYNIGSGTGGQPCATAKTRTCASGSCTTYDIPGSAG
jgi:putative FmdB family regulatory protein